MLDGESYHVGGVGWREFGQASQRHIDDDVVWEVTF